MEGLISKMRNTHKDLTPPPPPPPPPSFAAETAQASLGRRLQRALTGGSDRKFSGPHSPPGGAASPSLLMNRRLSFPILALLAVLTVGLLLLLPGGPLQAQESPTIGYAENGTGPVATYTAVDPEGKDITWSLLEAPIPGNADITQADLADFDDFTIENGVLMFKSAPDFEDPKGGQADNSNTYNVVVQASDGGTGTTDRLEVTVTVTNVDEDGTVGISLLQPQVGTELTATLSDPDVVVANTTTWQWAISSSGSTWTDIRAADGDMYTPVAEDVGNYLRARAEYTDVEGEDKSASMRATYMVRAAPASNSAPSFPDQEPGTPGEQTDQTREIMENVAVGTEVGAPVAASDGDGDVLTYTLGGDGAASFEIDAATGQLKTQVELDREATGGGIPHCHRYGYGPVRRGHGPDRRGDHQCRKRGRSASDHRRHRSYGLR